MVPGGSLAGAEGRNQIKVSPNGRSRYTSLPFFIGEQILWNNKLTLH
jgi:hypothetical protein